MDRKKYKNMDRNKNTKNMDCKKAIKRYKWYRKKHKKPKSTEKRNEGLWLWGFSHACV